MAKKKYTYSESITEIQDIITKIESGELEIDELVKNIKKASDLLNNCKAILKNTEEAVNDFFDSEKNLNN